MKKHLISVLAGFIFLSGAHYTNAASLTDYKSGIISTVKTGAAILLSFTDMASHWAQDMVLKAVQRGFVDGYEDGTFKPDQTITRAEYLKMLVVGLQLPMGNFQYGQQWYQVFVDAATKAGIYKPGEFSDWNQSMTRNEMARLAMRALDKNLQRASDAELLYNATKRGIISGMSDGEIAPDDTSTRAQSTVVIERILDVKEGKLLPVDKRAQSYAEVAWHGSNVETMLNMIPAKFPIKVDLGDSVDGWIDQAIVVDLDDPDGAFSSMFPKDKLIGYNYMGPISDLSNYVAIAVRINAKHDTAENSVMQLRRYLLPNEDTYAIGKIGPIVNEDPLLGSIYPIVDLRQPGFTQDYMMFYISKDVLNKKQANGAYYGLVLNRVNGSADYRIIGPKQ